MDWHTVENGCVDGKDSSAAKDNETTETKGAPRDLGSTSAPHAATLLHHPPKALFEVSGTAKKGITCPWDYGLP
jgi:hypothetical protein